MSQGLELLNEIISGGGGTGSGENEEHIVVNRDRTITVPESLKKIAIQYDHNIETLTFDCPRYWDDIDLSLMTIRINYVRSDGEPGTYQVKNTDVTIDSNDDKIMHFKWVVSNNVTLSDGYIVFAVCAVTVDGEGNLTKHWNTETNTETYVGGGLGCQSEVDSEKVKDLVALLTEKLNFIEIFDSASLTQELGNNDKAVMSQSAVTREINALKFNYNSYGIPVIEFSGDISAMNKDNAVTLNYIYGDKSGTCTLKWQGSSSLSYPKKNYTVKFDNAFEAKEGWGEQKKYCLKADWIDFSHCRNICSARLWGEMVETRSGVDSALLASPNNGAIDGFPCFVVINGEWKGIYNFNIPKDGWMMSMGSGNNEAIICADGNNKACMFRELATVSEDGGDFELEYNSDSFTAEQVQTSLNTLIQACLDSDGTDIDTTIAQYLDINSAIDYFIYAVVLYHLDGVSKNYILGTYDGVKWFFSAYDLDSTFGLYWDGKKFLRSGYSHNTANDIGNAFGFWSNICYSGKHRIFELLYKYKKAEIIARYKELRQSVLSTSNISRVVKEQAKQIPLAAYTAENELWSQRPSTGANNANQICEWVADRFKYTDAEISEMEIAMLQQPTEGLTYAFWSWFNATCRGAGVSSDTDVVIADYVKLLESSTGYEIDGLPVRYVSAEAFKGNVNITSVKFPETVESINQNAFYRCSNLKQVDIPNSVKYIGPGAFAESKIESIELPKSISIIKNYLCYNTPLTEITIPNNVTEIEEMAFRGCSLLEKVKLSNRLKTIGNHAFTRCTKVNKTLIIPKTVKTVGNWAFAQFWKCPKLVFKGTPDSIGENAFLEFGTHVYDEDGTTYIGADIYVPWAEGEVAGAPWGITNVSRIHYNSDVDNIN